MDTCKNQGLSIFWFTFLTTPDSDDQDTGTKMGDPTVPPAHNNQATETLMDLDGKAFFLSIPDIHQILIW